MNDDLKMTMPSQVDFFLKKSCDLMTEINCITLFPERENSEKKNGKVKKNDRN